ncbi:MAG TPA: PHP domain-containing protein [Anaeromyxobacter sp.]|nr:PHP domain-containing protein [Anaeromyxobacter sp.]
MAIRVDYHLHTGASYDSRTSDAQVIECALATGLAVVCVADHDTIEGAVTLSAAAPAGLRVVVGCEFTCDDGSHVIGMGLRRMVFERRLPCLLDAIRDQGGRVILPHPYRRGSGIFRHELGRRPEFVRQVLARADAVEIHNGRDTWENNRRSHELVLRHGLPAVAGSDAHRPEEIGRVWVEYLEPGYVDGVSPRTIYGPIQPPHREHPLKRLALEAYHAHAQRLPVVRAAYRALRARLHADLPRATGAPRMLHVLASPSPAAGDQAGPRPGDGGGALAGALSSSPPRGAGGAARIAR